MFISIVYERSILSFLFDDIYLKVSMNNVKVGIFENKN